MQALADLTITILQALAHFSMTICLDITNLCLMNLMTLMPCLEVSWEWVIIIVMVIIQAILEDQELTLVNKNLNQDQDPLIQLPQLPTQENPVLPIHRKDFYKKFLKPLNSQLVLVRHFQMLPLLRVLTLLH